MGWCRTGPVVDTPLPNPPPQGGREQAASCDGAALLADAEAAEDLPQHVLDVDPAGDPPQRVRGLAQVLGAQLDVALARPDMKACKADMQAWRWVL